MKSQLTLIGLFTTSKKPLSLQIPIYFKEKLEGLSEKTLILSILVSAHTQTKSLQKPIPLL